MAFAARLSKRFYDRLGEDIVNELVELLNQVLTDSRADLREFNEVNYARLDARLEQRTAELRADLRLLQKDMDSRFEAIDGRLETQSTAIHKQMAEQSAVIEKRLAEHTDRIDQRLRDHGRMMIAAWGLLMASLAALWFR